jgi:hypothetical protein
MQFIQYRPAVVMITQEGNVEVVRVAEQLVAMNLKKSVEFNSAENIQHKLDNPIGAMSAI